MISEQFSQALMRQFLVSNPSEVTKYKTRVAHGFKPIEKECEGAQGVILFQTTDEVDSARMYTLRAAVRTPGGMVWTMPEGMEIGGHGTRKAAEFRFESLKAPELYYIWNSGRLSPMFKLIGEMTSQSSSEAQNAKEAKNTEDAPKKKMGRPAKIADGAAPYTIMKFHGPEPYCNVDFAGLNIRILCSLNTNVIPWTLRPAKHPRFTREDYFNQFPHAEREARLALYRLKKQGIIKIMDFDDLLSEEGKTPEEYAAEMEAGLAEKEAKKNNQKPQALITEKQPEGQELIRKAIIKIQDGTFDFIGDVMWWLMKQGMKEFKEEQMLEILKAKGIRIQTH